MNEWPSEIKRYNWNQKVPGLNPTTHLVELGDQTTFHMSKD